MLTGRRASRAHRVRMGVHSELPAGHAQRACFRDKLVTPAPARATSTRGTFSASVSTHKLVGSHCYHVFNVNFRHRIVTLRNPWGKDVNTSDGGVASGDNSDGIVKITLNQFMDSMDTVGIS